eukprot:3479985-Rhodomonas_salina.6
MKTALDIETIESQMDCLPEEEEETTCKPTGEDTKVSTKADTKADTKTNTNTDTKTSTKKRTPRATKENATSASKTIKKKTKGIRRPYCSLDADILADRLTVMQKRHDVLAVKLTRAASTLDKLTVESSYRTMESPSNKDNA